MQIKQIGPAILHEWMEKQRLQNLDFILFARTALPYWLKEIKRLRAELDKVTASRDEFKDIGQRAMVHVAAMRVVLEDWENFAAQMPRNENLISNNLTNTKKVLDHDAGTILRDAYLKLRKEFEDLDVDNALLQKQLSKARACITKADGAIRKFLVAFYKTTGREEGLSDAVNACNSIITETALFAEEVWRLEKISKTAQKACDLYFTDTAADNLKSAMSALKNTLEN